MDVLEILQLHVRFTLDTEGHAAGWLMALEVVQGMCSMECSSLQDLKQHLPKLKAELQVRPDSARLFICSLHWP